MTFSDYFRFFTGKLPKNTPPIFVNSNGQSGTNLIIKLLTLIGLRRTTALNVMADNGYASRVTGGLFDFPGFDPNEQLLVGVNWPGYARSDEIRSRFASLPPRYFGAGHIPYTPAAAKLLDELGYKVILIVRDPRDWAYSNARRTMEALGEEIDVNIEQYCARAVFGNEQSPKLRGRCSLSERYAFMSRWQICKNVLTVKYEDIVGPNGGGFKFSQTRNTSYHWSFGDKSKLLGSE